MKHSLKLVFGLAIAAALTGCEVAQEFGAGYSYMESGKGAAEAYPKLPAFEAQRRHAQDQFKLIAARQETEADKREMAAAFYAGFANYNARAIPGYCAQMNLHPDDFVEKFYKMNAREEKALEEVLALRKMTKEDIWKKHERRMMNRAKYDLMGGNISPGSAASCRKIRDNPDFFLKRTNFRNQFFDIYRTLVK